MASLSPSPSPSPSPAPAVTTTAADPEPEQWTPVISVVGFHHARGPEVETWFGVPEASDPAAENDWAFLPFMALSDGAHASTEDFSYFTLRRKATETLPATSLFGMSCTRQLDAKELIDRPDDVTRSTVQKSVVVLAQSPHAFAAWREKLSLVTRAWFMQSESLGRLVEHETMWADAWASYRDFTNTKILKEFQENLAETERNTSDEERDQFVGVSLREFIHEFKHQALVLFKCCLLQPKMLFFSHRCERLCMMQFALISLIPGLIRKLDDCADPELDSYEKSVVAPTSLKTSNRASLLAYVGLPIQIFGKGSLFGPYTPLQQLDVLADVGTKSYIVGSTNSLLLQQKDRYSDIIINLDEATMDITSTSLRAALALSAADRRWIDLIYQDVLSSWDPANPSRPRDLGFKGSEDYIRILFEQYMIALLSATRYHLFLSSVPVHKRAMVALPDVEGDPALDFGEAWLESWKTTSSFRLWSRLTDSQLFALVDPRHPTAGGFSVDDFNRRFAQQLHDLHLDERFATSREVLGKHLASGQKKVSAAINNIWADFEARRAAQRAKMQQESSDPDSAEKLGLPGQLPGESQTPSPGLSPASSSFFDAAAMRARAPDLTGAQAAVGVAGQKAGAYFSSWGTWAAERRKGWAAKGGKEEDMNAGSSPAISAENNRLSRSGEPAGPTSLHKLVVNGQVGLHETTAPKTTNNGVLATEEGAEDGGDEKKAAVVSQEQPLSPAKGRRTSQGGGVPQSPKSPTTAKSPRKSIGRRGTSKEEVGSDGIGRLDA